MTKHSVIIYAHGFGVRKDDRGMFTDIAQALPGYEHIFVDLNDSENEASITVGSIRVQAERLRRAFEAALQQFPGADIDIICHSQGCLVAGLAELPSRQILLITPPFDAGTDAIKRLFLLRPESSELNKSGVSYLARADGSVTSILAEYWSSFEGLKPVALYDRLAVRSKVLILNAHADEILGPIDNPRIPDSLVARTIPGDHNFSGPARGALLAGVSRFFMRGE